MSMKSWFGVTMTKILKIKFYTLVGSSEKEIISATSYHIQKSILKLIHTYILLLWSNLQNWLLSHSLNILQLQCQNPPIYFVPMYFDVQCILNMCSLILINSNALWTWVLKLWINSHFWCIMNMYGVKVVYDYVVRCISMLVWYSLVLISIALWMCILKVFMNFDG
jgi:hypothetical protein